jgi:hypothetical protein
MAPHTSKQHSVAAVASTLSRDETQTTDTLQPLR